MPLRGWEVSGTKDCPWRPGLGQWQARQRDRAKGNEEQQNTKERRRAAEPQIKAKSGRAPKTGEEQQSPKEKRGEAKPQREANGKGKEKGKRKGEERPSKAKPNQA